MKNPSAYFILGMALLLAKGVLPVSSSAQDLLEGTQYTKLYLLEISGKTMDENFTGAQALLYLMPPAPGAPNPYQVVIVGYPKRNSRNSFYWNSEFTEMTSVANDITCEIKRTYVKPSPIHFIFMSPELLRHTGALTGEEGKKYAERTALPTLIQARAGKLKLKVHSNFVSGTVWMSGYDFVEKAFVTYSARLHGRRAYNLEPRQELKK